MQLLRPPFISYIRELKRITNGDPQYLMFHSSSVTLRIRGLLAVYSDRERSSDSDREVLGWVKEAIVRLGSFEK